jgi:probable rRNA maturation factor
MLKIKVAIPQEIVPIQREPMRAAAKAVLEGEGVAQASLSLAFVDDATIHRINKQFLEHDEPTDVITFPLSQPNAKVLEGELVIGAEVARRVAAERGHDEQVELALYVIHGVLHLCGYDDKTEKHAREMRTQERKYLKALGLPDIAEE